MSGLNGLSGARNKSPRVCTDIIIDKRATSFDYKSRFRYGNSSFFDYFIVKINSA